VIALARYVTVGVSNTLVTLFVFIVLTTLGVAAPAAGALAFIGGGVNGYFLNSSWTFAGARRGIAVAGRYATVQGLGAGLDALGLAALALPHLAGEALVVPCVTLVTFVLSRQWVFARR
jgi:putative flippase GtrA